MKCLYYSHNKSKVTDKRISTEEIHIRKKDLKCEKRFIGYKKIIF